MGLLLLVTAISRDAKESFMDAKAHWRTVLRNCTILGLLVLAGCAAGLTETQGKCMRGTDKFDVVVACVRKQDPDGPAGYIADYWARVDLLEKQYRSGQLNDMQAIMALQDYLTRLRASY